MPVMGVVRFERFFRAAAVRGMTRRGVVRVDGRSLTIPWEALPGYYRSPAAPPSGGPRA